MDFLFVKTKGRQGTFRKVLSNQTVYSDISEFDDKRPYSDELNLRDGQWFVLEQFSQKDTRLFRKDSRISRCKPVMH